MFVAYVLSRRYFKFSVFTSVLSRFGKSFKKKYKKQEHKQKRDKERKKIIFLFYSSISVAPIAIQRVEKNFYQLYNFPPLFLMTKKETDSKERRLSSGEIVIHCRMQNRVCRLPTLCAAYERQIILGVYERTGTI